MPLHSEPRWHSDGHVEYYDSVICNPSIDAAALEIFVFCHIDLQILPVHHDSDTAWPLPIRPLASHESVAECSPARAGVNSTAAKLLAVSNWALPSCHCHSCPKPRRGGSALLRLAQPWPHWLSPSLASPGLGPRSPGAGRLSHARLARA